MSKQLSLYTLIGLMILIGVLFYRVIEPFLVVLFIGVVLAVLVEPIQHWLKRRLNGRRRVAAAINTALVLLVIILPICAVLLLAGKQMASTGQMLISMLESKESGEPSQAMEMADKSPLVQRLVSSYERLGEQQRTQLKGAVSDAVSGFVTDLYDKTTGLLGNVISAGIGLFILILAVYYFLADGREFISELRKLLPLEQGEEDELFDQFHSVCRGVVLGAVAAGVAQAIFACVAFAVIGVEQLWLLTVLTMICSFIPFVGAVGVWAPVAIALALNGQWGAAIGLSLYGFFIISTIDNLIRAHVIGGEAQLHPLIALVSVLGALQLVGLWGIFIGPMIAAFFYTLAHLLRRRILLPDRNKPVLASESASSQENKPSANAGLI